MSKRKTTVLGARRGGSNKRLNYGALVSTAAIGIACQGLLGVEDVHQGPPPGAGTGSGATSGSGGSGGSGGKGAGGASGKGGTAGTTTGGAGGKGGTSGGTSGTSGTGGDSGEGGSGDTGGTGGSTGGSGGAGGAGGSAGMAGSGGSNAGSAGSAGAVNNDPTVRGKVINHWLHPVPNVPVWIGDVMATTDPDGLFEIPDVGATYDAKLVLTFTRYGDSGQEQYGWVYEGLTRRDPTLQVYWGLPLTSANHQLTLTNAPIESNAIVVSALGGEYHNWSRESPNGVQTSTDWYGPGTVTMTGHGLTWLETNGLPTSFTAYTTTSTPIAFADSGGQTMWALDLKPTAVTTGAIGGTVNSATTGSRSNRAFVQFTTGASIQLFDHYGSSLTDDFTYTVPTIPGASITMSAAEGPGVWGALGVAHADNLAAGATSIALDIPAAPVITAPPAGTTLSASSVLSWATGTHDTYVFRAISDGFYEGVFVVTARTQINMPTFPNGFALRPNDEVSWRVETHGTAQTVDELAGANGFADSFAYSWGDYPEGPRRDSGSFTMAAARWFITAP